MDKAAKRVVCAYGAAGVLSQLLFGFIYFAMRDEFVFAPIPVGSGTPPHIV